MRWSPINLDADSHRLFLKALETGSALHYALITKDNKRVIDTRLNTLFSADYALWRDEMLQHTRRPSRCAGPQREPHHRA